jgi:hypothetical protein
MMFVDPKKFNAKTKEKGKIKTRNENDINLYKT